MSGRGRDFAEGVSSSGDWWWVLLVVVVVGGMVIHSKYEDWKMKKDK